MKTDLVIINEIQEFNFIINKNYLFLCKVGPSGILVHIHSVDIHRIVEIG